MTQSSRTFRISVCPTFSDLKEERNALQDRVFPLTVFTLPGECLHASGCKLPVGNRAKVQPMPVEEWE